MIGRLLKAQMRGAKTRELTAEELAFHAASLKATHRKSAELGARGMIKAMPGEPRAAIFNAIVEMATPLVGKIEACALADEMLKQAQSTDGR